MNDTDGGRGGERSIFILFLVLAEVPRDVCLLQSVRKCQDLCETCDKILCVLLDWLEINEKYFANIFFKKLIRSDVYSNSAKAFLLIAR